MDLFGQEEPTPRGHKVIVTGGRDFTDQKFIYDSLDHFHESLGISALFHGAANGVDNLCGTWAWEQGIPVFECRANWKRFPRAAGPIRNHWMKNYADAKILIAFPGKRGTAHMVEACEKFGMTVYHYTPHGEQK